MEMQIPAYLGFLAGSGILSCLLYGKAAQRQWGGKKAFLTAVTTLILAAALGTAGAKLGYLLLRADIFPWKEPFSVLGEWDVNELSYYGGMAGVVLAVAIAARWNGCAPGTALNLFAPAGAFLAGMARFGEGFLGMLGVGMYMEDGGLPLAVRFTWDGEWYEAYLAVFLFEGVFSLIACVLAQIHRDEPDRFRRTLFYLCLPQIVLESLRMQSISWLFVRAEQLMCYLLCEGILLWYAFRAGGRGAHRWISPLIGLLVCGVVAAGEFALDGKIGFENADIPTGVIYALDCAALIGMAWMEHMGHKDWKRSVNVRN